MTDQHASPSGTPVTPERLTAYALGEVDDPRERADIERHLADHPEARAHVESVRRLGDDLAAAMETEPPDALDDGRREAIRDEAAAPLPGPWVKRWAKPMAIAAMVVVLCAVGVGLLLPSLGAARRTARSMQAGGVVDPQAQGQWRGSIAMNDNHVALEIPATPLPEVGAINSAREPSRLDGSVAPSTRTPNGYISQTSPEAIGTIAGSITWEAALQREAPLMGDRNTGAHGGRRAGQDRFFNPTIVGRWESSPADNPAPVARTPELTPAPAPPVEPAALGDLPGRDHRDFNTEQYGHLIDNPFHAVADRPLSTFSVDVDTAGHALVRRFLMRESMMPPADAVRIEEMVNYFDYGYPTPSGDPAEGDAPFAAHLDVAACPWNPGHRLVRIGLQGWAPGESQRLPANLVFLLDVSGSMNSPDKLPLLKQAFGKLVGQLRPEDRVAIVVYAGASGLVLDTTPGSERADILAAIDRLRAGGSTNGGAGIELAYAKAREAFIDGGVNRVLLATDGDFNVGVTNRGDLVRLIQDKARSGVYLSVLGFGTGNLKDETMERLSNEGDGNYAYIDSAREAEKVLVRQVAGTLRTIAKDVKVQVEFNPAAVHGYRLIGYANRLLRKEDFNDDTKDAGDIGAGHSVTALYEVVPARPVDLQAIHDRIAAIQAGLDPTADPPNFNLHHELGRLEAQRDAYGKTSARIAELAEERQRERTAADLPVEADLQLKARVDELRRLAERANLTPDVDPLKYQRPVELSDDADSGELMTVKLRYKRPDAKKVQGTSELLGFAVLDDDRPFAQAPDSMRFAASVAAFGMLLRDSDHAGTATYADAIGWARDATENDPHGDRAELLAMMQRAQALDSHDR